MTRLLLASDFDGTLAPIHPDPDAVRIDPRALELLRGAAQMERVQLALVSGRDVDDLRARAGGLPAWYSGSHGLEIVAPDGSRVKTTEPWSGRPDPDWLQRASAAGLRLEPKRYGIGVHWRGAAGIDESHPLIRELEEWAAARGLSLIHGRMVVEASVAGSTKRDVLAFLADRTGAERIVYAGDDLTDFPALELAATRGRGLFVASAERPEGAPPGVETVRDRDELLAAFEQELARAADA
ncbi:MAG TPA: trehalose-phosphatase [Thermoanaerobaculia bacterium]|nr:trehalose-phosphatase [Thermoanaerobaculia bacterium]